MLNIDWDLLRKQKATLLEEIQLAESGDTPDVADDLTGILHLIDAIQDEAAEEFGEETVFGS